MIIKMIKLFFNRKNLSQKEHITKLRSKYWQREKAILEQELKMQQEKKEITDKRFNIKFNTSKLFAFLLFINFTAIEIFTAWVTIKAFALAYAIGIMPDFTPLITLIGAIIGQTLSYGIYSNKAKAENMKNGITYEIAMSNMQNNNEINEDQGVG